MPGAGLASRASFVLFHVERLHRGQTFGKFGCLGTHRWPHFSHRSFGSSIVTAYLYVKVSSVSSLTLAGLGR
jgi:hypothetical protein